MYKPKKVAVIGATKPKYERYCPHWGGLMRGFEENGVDAVLVNSRHNENWVQDVIASKADLVIYGLLSAVIDTPAREKIRQRLPNAISVFWYGDARTDVTGQVDCDLSKEIDFIFQSNDGLKLFTEGKFGIMPAFLPLACNVQGQPTIKEKYTFPFLFIGAKVYNKGFEERAEIIDTLERYHGLKVINGARDPLRTQVYQEMPALYASSSVTLDISHFWHIPKYTSNRFWVIPANWGLAVTKRFPDCEELYPPATRLYWDTIDELMEKVRFYNQNEKEREKMIRLGWEHTRDNHTYAHRVRKLFELIEGGVGVSRKTQSRNVSS
ncbi:MAG: glycosyltransferase [Candidatus Poseidoniales archaeon]|jgi:spore maturation protein CgeB